ncbi:MAG: fatty acid desaturase [Lasallia pustulata]|uniref:Delta 8-(E)-sphingolipid desaturase n=1 Tax=Lasallia pustulata TaxID=136370 RepID=A0A5M8PT07_9LECA|nr:MAG: fatty acid desaturase [Lasallia pustulata]
MGRSTASKSRKETVLTRREIEGLIADGRSIIIVENKVLKADVWLKYHPGGDKAIMHMVGRDATDEVNALHSAEARKRMDAYQIGVVEGRWNNFLPPIQGGRFRAYVECEERLEFEEHHEQNSSSESSSASGSPLFEPAGDRSTRIRRRRSSHGSGLHAVSSVSSLSSIEPLEHEKERKLSHMDAYTQHEINLDLAKYPALDPATQDGIVQRYRQLNERIRAEGLYQCNYISYMIELCRYSFLFGMCLLCLHWSWYGTSGLFLGVFWHQLVFTAHDAGHMGITHSFTLDTIIGIIIADFLGGLSLGWWKRNHNVHHIVTNSPEHDPDIEHMPFFAISHRFFDSLRSTYYDRIMTYDFFAKFTIRYQQYLYYPILTLGRFNLYRLSWEYLLLGLGPNKGPAWWHRWLEIAGQLFFWTWFGYGIVYHSIPTISGRLAFILVSHMVTAPLHVQITLSHFAMSTADLGVHESFPQKMLRTTMDVDCPEWLDFFHGGLQFQAVHHLYPRIPRHNLRRTQKLVRGFCEEVGIPYALYGFVDGNREVVGRLGEVGRQARILAECQRRMAERGDYGGH